jgi:hypothetical protein
MKTVLIVLACVGLYFLFSWKVGEFFGLKDAQYRELTGEDCHE